MLTDELRNFIPDEYLSFFNNLEKNEMESFLQSYVSRDQEIHPYLQFFFVIERTMKVYNTPSPLWRYMFGRLAFYGSEYAYLQSYHTDFPDDIYVLPFVARMVIFQNRFEEGQELCNKVLDNLTTCESIVDVMLKVETYFSLGYSYYYLGDIAKLTQIIDELERFTGTHAIQKFLAQEDRSNVAMYEQLLSSMKALRSGNPKELEEVTSFVIRWVDSVTDPWLRGYFFNIYGIALIQSQKMSEGENYLLKALELLNQVNDLRTYSAVGANLGTLLILEGRRLDGRKILEDVLEAFVTLGNYSIALTHMLFISKQYLEAGDIHNSIEYLKWAEGISSNIEVTEPAVFSHFCYLYSKLREFEKAQIYLDKLDEKVKAGDLYSQIWYYQAKANYSASVGNLKDAEEVLKEGIQLADKNRLFDSSLELTFLYIQVRLKQYMLTEDEGMIEEALEKLDDLAPLIATINNRYFNTIIHLIKGYMYAILGRPEKIQQSLDEIGDVSEISDDSQKEVVNFINKIDVVFNPLPDDPRTTFILSWMSHSHLGNYWVVEAIRLLYDLQFQQFDMTAAKESEDLPVMLLIVQTNGLTIYSHKFKEESMMDEQLISALLMAMSSFSQEVFGEGLLKRIEQEQHVLLLERLNATNLVVLVVEEETYMLRKQFRILMEEMVDMHVGDYLEEGNLLGEGDPQFDVLEQMVTENFGTSFNKKQHSDNIQQVDEGQTSQVQQQSVEDHQY